MSRSALWSAVAVASLLSGSAISAVPAPDISGQYRIGRSGMIVAIAACGEDRLCGRIAGLGTLAPTDANNPVPALQGRHLCGVAVLGKLEWRNGSWSGELYEPADGTNYAITLTAASDGGLRVLGHSGRLVLSRTYKRPVEVWERVSPPSPACGAAATS